MLTAGTELCCPRCKGALAANAGGLRCAGCASEYRVEDGIADLRCGRMDYYFNPVPREEMNKLIEDAEHEPWPKIVRRFMVHVNDNPDWLDDLIIDARYAWKLGLELPPDARFLDLGCGLGNLTKNIAPHVGQVVALDLTWERLRFAKRRFARFNANDQIQLVAGGDGKYLPFPDSYFDCVALSGVLEWVADVEEWDGPGSKLSKAARMFMSMFGESNPRAMQLKFLREIRRITKPAGQLFVAIENRLNYEYFGKRPDHHTRLWYGSLLPRPVANLYSIAVNRRPYRTYTYSLGGARSLFREAGFSSQEFLGFLEGYTNLTEIIPLRTGNGDFWRRPQMESLQDKIKRSDHFVPAHGIIASIEVRQPNALLRRIVSAINGALSPDATPLMLHSCRITAKEKAVFTAMAGSNPAIVSIACNAAAAAAQARHYGFLERATRFDGLAAMVPAPLTRGRVQNIPFTVERQMPGRPLVEELKVRGRVALLPDVATLLHALNPAPKAQAIVALEGADFERLVARPLQKVLESLDDTALANEASAAMLRRLSGIPVRLGLMHGDFSVQNIFADKGKVSGLIDWEDVDPDGLPILDALNYLESAQRAFQPGSTLLATVPLLASGDWPVVEERNFLAQYYEHLGLDAAYHREFAVLYWLYHIRPQLEFSLAYDRREIRQRIELVVREILRFW